MTPFDCTHLVLYASNLQRTHDFYRDLLKCSVRVFNEQILGIDVGRIFINFYPVKSGAVRQSVDHIGLELPTRAHVDEWFTHLHSKDVAMHLSSVQAKNSNRQKLASIEQLQANQVSGPYRFYLSDPDGFQLQLHTWDGVDD